MIALPSSTATTLESSHPEPTGSPLTQHWQEGYRYFWDRWPALLGPFLPVVLALHHHADRRDGTTYASMPTIAATAGIGVRKLRRMLAKDPPENASAAWREAHRLFHLYWLIDRKPRRRPGDRRRRTTDLLTVRLSIPLTPADAARLRKEQGHLPLRKPETMNQPTRPVEEPRPAAPATPAPPAVSAARAPASLPVKLAGDRSDLIVRSERCEQAHPAERRGLPTKAPPHDPLRSAGLSREDRARRELLADEIGEKLTRLDELAGNSTERKPGGGSHGSAGFHLRTCFLMPEHLVREALTATHDAFDGRTIDTTPSRFFAGCVRRIAAREGIHLGVRWRTPAHA